MLPLPRFLTLPAAVLAGNWLGSRIQTGLTGRPAQGLTFDYVDGAGVRYRNIPVSTKFFPALLLAVRAERSGRSGLTAGFLVGALAGLLLRDEHEAALHRRVMGLVTRAPGASGAN